MGLGAREAVMLGWIAALAAGATSLGLGFAFSGWDTGNLTVVAALVAVAALAEHQRIRLSSNLEQSISLVPTLFAAVLFGPLASMLVAAVSYSTHFRRPYMKWATYTCSRAITGATTGFVAVKVASFFNSELAAIAVATTAGAVVLQVLDLGFATATVALRGKSALAIVRAAGPLVIAAVPLYAPIVALLAYSYAAISAWSLLFFLAPAVAAQRLFVLYQRERKLRDELVSTNSRLQRANLSFATALVATLDARDEYTAGHSAAVAIYARDIALRIDLTKEEQELAHLCGLVHDIGKIGLPAGLLEKPGALTLDERRQMEKHSEIGERILAKVDDYAEIARIVRHHHERWDGQGYPDRLGGDDIPLISRIIAVADAYNAMTSHRPYRDAMPSRVARLRLAQGVESQFDTAVVAAFEAVLASASEAYRLAQAPEFSFEEQDSISQRDVSAEAA